MREVSSEGKDEYYNNFMKNHTSNKPRQVLYGEPENT